MNKRNAIKTALTGILLLASVNQASAEVLCKDKKTGAILSRPGACKKKEIPVSGLELGGTVGTTTAGTTTGVDLSLTDNGAITSGSDVTTGLDVSVNRINAQGGTLNTTGMNLSVVGDSGGDSTNVGLSVTTSGADNNYCAIFQGGNVGIGVSDPDEQLELTGRIHLGKSSAPGDSADKLYNVDGSLYWGGQKVGIESSSSGGITSVLAGSGLSGGGTSGAVTLSVDAGTTAGKLVQLNSSAQLPAVSGANLTSLNASSISSGTVPDSNLSSNVSLLGSSIGLSSEVSGVLPVANGGTGTSSLADLIALGSQTNGNYVATVSTSSGLLGGNPGEEGAAITLTLDPSYAATWTATHSFQTGINVGTTSSSPEALHVNGRMHMEQGTAPSVITDKLYNVGGDLFFNGKNLSTSAAGGDITGITTASGSGLLGGADSGAVTLSVDTGTAANKIVKLDSSARLPAVSGLNLTNLNASNLASGTVDTARLPNTISYLGTDIDLASTEVTGILPVAKGGTGVSSLTDFIALGTNTTGNYVASVAVGSGITLNTTGGSEGAAATLSLNQAFTPTWTGTHTFSGVATDITTGTNQDFAIVPNGTGKVGIGTTTPSAMLDTVLSTTSTTAGNDTAAEINLTDSGVVTSGSDNGIGVDVNVSRTGASSGTITSTGVDINVAGDTGGTSTATGLNVYVSGADTNYAALFDGGYVGIGTTAPTSLFHSKYQSASSTAATKVGNKFEVTDTGAVNSGTDNVTGVDLSMSRTSATGGTINSTGLNISLTGDTGGSSKTTALNVSASGADTNYAALFTSGDVGIGTSSPTAKLHTTLTSTSTNAGTEIASKITVNDTGNVTTGTDTTGGLDVTVSRTGGGAGGTYNTSGLALSVTGDSQGTSQTTGLSVAVTGADKNVAATFTGGSVEIGGSATVLSANVPSGSLVLDNGTLCVEDGSGHCDDASRNPGTIYASDATVADIDLAENFPIEDGDAIEPGDVVMINTHTGDKCLETKSDDKGEQVCSKSTDGLIPFVTRSNPDNAPTKRVLGIVSTKPGFTLGGFGRRELIKYKKVPIALAGRVPVKVSLENGPIELGDRLAPSSTPGLAKRASEGDHIIGIALEAYEGVQDGDNGKILTLVK